MLGISPLVGVIGMQPITILIKIKSTGLSSHITHVLLMHALTRIITRSKNRILDRGEVAVDELGDRLLPVPKLLYRLADAVAEVLDGEHDLEAAEPDDPNFF